MRFLPFVLKHLSRHKVRTASTILAMSVCIFLFCTLQTFIRAVNWGLQSANASRLIARHAVSIIFRLPLPYRQRIAGIPGVKSVVPSVMYGGVYTDMKDFFPNFAVDAEPYFAMYPEYQVPPDQFKAFLGDMRGCIVGRETAEKFKWKVGDAFQMSSFIPYYKIGKPFEFVIRGIYDADLARYPGTNVQYMFFHFKYLQEATNHRWGTGTYVIEIADPNRAGVISKAVDEMFENSDAQTKTDTEAAFRAGFVSMAGNLVLLLNGIGLAVTFTILLVTANTMSMAVRERRTEIAVLKTLGFKSGLVMALIMAEAIALGALGGMLGIFLGKLMISALPDMPFIGDAVRGYPRLGLSPTLAAAGVAMAVALGLVAGFIPALIAYKSKIAEMLRPI